MPTLKSVIYLLIFASGIFFWASCKSNTSYPCPKKNTKREANVKKDEDGGVAPSNSKGRSSKKDNGLIKKKQPKRIHKKR
ncbi:hypothetical protein OAH12_03090 [Cyclobacteriaceae bacterium]|nr:hypothetical protein [Cyclobacteriaceae bacterium]